MAAHKGVLNAYQKQKSRQNDEYTWNVIGAYWLSVEKEAQTAIERLKLYREAGLTPADLKERSENWGYRLGSRLVKESGITGTLGFNGRVGSLTRRNSNNRARVVTRTEP